MFLLCGFPCMLLFSNDVALLLLLLGGKEVEAPFARFYATAVES